jgi:dihydrodiol dehydrogenase / D-xylose 1-dehydrogenase (NADP)
MNKIRWGILGTGSIAKAFVEGLSVLNDTEIIAVGSRNQKTADEFAKKFNIPKAHSTYEKLANDPEVDVIYISTPHNFHADNSILCINSGKAVLCEKPFTVNAMESRQVVKLAREKNIFIMEAMWSRCLPIYKKVREWISDGLIGEVRMLHADFGFNAGWNPAGRTLNPNLAGGALLDVGIYPISFAFWIFGKKPERILSMAHIGSTGVDEQNAMIFGYDKGALAVLSSACQTNTQKEAFIIGTKGFIKLLPPFWKSQKAMISINGKEEYLDVPFTGNGYNYEAMEVMKCMREDLPESPIMPLDESISIMDTMDMLRKEWNYKYPFEDSNIK